MSIGADIHTDRSLSLGYTPMQVEYLMMQPYINSDGTLYKLGQKSDKLRQKSDILGQKSNVLRWNSDVLRCTFVLCTFVFMNDVHIVHIAHRAAHSRAHRAGQGGD